jgi:hypothetical protein
MKRWIAIPLAGLGSFALCEGITLPVIDEARADDAAMTILAVQIRRQGYDCAKPKSAKRDTDDTKPDAKVWVLTCENATYRIQTIPNMADKVERLE